MVARAAESMPPGSTDFLPTIQRAFETIGFAKTSASGTDASGSATCVRWIRSR